MADRIVEDSSDEIPEIPEVLEKVLLFSLNEAKEKLSQSQEVVPFTCLVVKDNLFIENHPGSTVEECFNAARHTVEHAQGAQAYALCYDGYVETDEGSKDTIIAEGGIPSADSGFAIGYLYELDEEGKPTFENEPAYIGPAPNFMIALRPAGEYADSEIADKYTEADVVDE